MFGALLTAAGPLLVLAALRSLPSRQRHPLLGWLLIAGYVARMIIATFIRDISLFSTGPGGDSQGYEIEAGLIAKLWSYGSIHYVTGTELPMLHDTSLPQNLFAAIVYLNGGPTHIGCCAAVAIVGCLAVLTTYRVSIDIGASRQIAFALAMFVLFMPSFVLYTSDTYKDGFVVFFIVGALGSAIRLARAISIRHLAFALLCLVGLWLTRFYLVYVMFACIVIGTLGVRSRSVPRLIATALALTIVLIVAVAYSNAASTIAESASQTFQRGTSDAVLASNASGGSGIAFGTGSPFGAFVPKLLYTLFSPFPWQGGSMGLQIGKLEVLVWYYVAYRAVRAGLAMWRSQKGDLLVLSSAIIPLILVYTVSFSNIGLVVRERMGLVVATAVMATLSWPRSEAAEAFVPQPSAA